MMMMMMMMRTTMTSLSLSSLFPVSPLLLPLRPQSSSFQSHLPNSISFSKLSSSIAAPYSPTYRYKTLVHGSNSSEPKESRFFDENGAVDDMDGYLNYLSLEYDSVWDTKPSWCQPWTITLTGGLVIAGSWLVLHSVAISAIVSALIFSWWYIFLYSYPKAYSDMIAERRDRVNDGVEDTFGLKKNQ